MKTSTRTLLALAATVSMTAAACSSDGDDAVTTDAAVETEAPAPTDVPPATDAPVTTQSPADTTPADTEAPTETQAVAVDDGASTLRANLTSLLQEHVYLSGIGFETAVDAGGDLEDPAVMAAVATLDENTVALADAVGSIAGQENGDAFLALWREHIGFFVDYKLGQATGDQAKVDQALTDLEGYGEQAGAFFDEITGGAIAEDDVVAGLEEHVATLTAAIDSIVAGDADAFDNLKVAAEHMKGTALLLSTGIVEAVPDMFPGSTTSEPAEVRATLTYQLQEHVYLASIALEQAIEAGADLEAPAVVAAVATLDQNTVDLAETVASVAGEEKGDAFLALWREHIGFFVDYTLGQATGDQAMVDQALSDLDGYREQAGAFFEEVTGGETAAEDVIAGLDVHVDTLTQAIDDLVAGDTAAFSDVRVAAQHMPEAALLLSTGIVAATS